MYDVSEEKIKNDAVFDNLQLRNTANITIPNTSVVILLYYICIKWRVKRSWEFVLRSQFFWKKIPLGSKN